MAEIAAYRKNLQLSINKVVQAFPYLENFSTIKAVLAGDNPADIIGTRIGLEVFEALDTQNNIADNRKALEIKKNLRLQRGDRPKNEKTKNSIFGTPLVMPIQLDELQLPAATIITTVQASRKINMTDVQGKDFSVLETSGLENYKINIKGVATAVEVYQDGVERFPTYWIRNFRKLIEKKGALEVKSDVMSLFNIKYLLIKGFSFDFQMGVQGWFAFDIDCINDDNVELELWNESDDASVDNGVLA